MPAYFSIGIEFDRHDINCDTVRNFHLYLENIGLKFKSGYWGSENDSLDEIIVHNQKLLENNFQLGMTEHFSHDYKQSLFEYSDFSEVRGFILNNSPVEHEYEYIIIIPESEVINYTPNEDIFKKKETDILAELAVKLWNIPSVKSIQTGLECSDPITPENKINNGILPLMNPFAIISEKCLNALDISKLEVKTLASGGCLLIPKNIKFK